MQEVVDAERGDAQFVKLLLETTSEAMRNGIKNMNHWPDDALEFPNGASRSPDALAVLERAYQDLAERAARREGTESEEGTVRNTLTHTTASTTALACLCECSLYSSRGASTRRCRRPRAQRGRPRRRR